MTGGVKTGGEITGHRDAFIKLNTANLSYSKTVEYLGVILDETLNVKQHIQMKSEIFFKNIGILHRISTCYPKNMLIKLYYALVYPYLTSSNTILGAASETTFKKILILKKRAARVINDA